MSDPGAEEPPLVDDAADELELFGPTHEGAHPVIVHEALDRLRSFCALLPETTEINPFGQPTFRVATRTFVSFELVGDDARVLFKIHPDLQAALVAREGFIVEPETGHHGWTYATVGEPVEWDELDGLIIGSYRLVAPPDFVSLLDRMLGLI